jgi:CubicO group peptidase (beta-lactamase class C family)
MSAFKPDIPRLRAEASALIEEYHLPGIGIGVVQGNETILAEGFGWANIAEKQPYSPEARHRIGSITKTMIGLCVMALVEDGRLSLDSRIADLLPDIQLHGYGDALTVRHLLTHTGGIGEAPNLDDLKKPFDKLFSDTAPGAPLASLYTEGITIETPPGSKWAYANHGFALLGEIVSRTEGAPLAEVVELRVFGPLGMTSSDLNDEPHAGLARGYTQAETPEARQLIDFLGIQLESDTPEDGHNMPGKFVRVWGNGGAGAVQSTVIDMCAYASALLRGGGGIVKPETLSEMVGDQYRPEPRLPGWGLSFGVGDVTGMRSFGHGGAVFGGWNSHLGVFPDLDAALVIHVNLHSDDFAVVSQPRLVEAFLGTKPAVATGDGQIDSKILETAPGVYELPDDAPLTNFRPRFNPGRIQIANDGGRLAIHSRRGMWKDGGRLEPVDPSDPEVFDVIADGYTNFRMLLCRNSGGDVTRIRFPRLIEMYKNPERQPWA